MGIGLGHDAHLFEACFLPPLAALGSLRIPFGSVGALFAPFLISKRWESWFGRDAHLMGVLFATPWQALGTFGSLSVPLWYPFRFLFVS